jgi:DNA repair exonuclease SbcCD ATPase subunit
MSYPTKPTLKSTDKELLLSIHPDLREKAKKIPNYRWDREKASWVYPNDRATLDAIHAEFGNDLIVSFSKPHQQMNLVPVSSPNEMLSQRIKELKEENQENRKQLNACSNSEKKNLEQIQSLVSQMEKRGDQFSTFQEDTLTVQKELRKELHDVKEEKIRLEAKIKALNNEIELKTSESTLENQLKTIALETTGGEKSFENFLSNVRIDNSLPPLVQSVIEKKLRKALDLPQRDHATDCFTLIQMSVDRNILDKDSADLAHAIRKQRNEISHPDEGYTHLKMSQARIVVCLLAFALLWPNLPE